MKDLLEYLAKAIADKKEAIRVVEEPSEGGGLVLTLISDPLDTGKLIGKRGVTAYALKNLLRIKAAQLGQRFFLEIKSTEEASQIRTGE